MRQSIFLPLERESKPFEHIQETPPAEYDGRRVTVFLVFMILFRLFSNTEIS